MLETNFYTLIVHEAGRMLPNTSSNTFLYLALALAHLFGMLIIGNVVILWIKYQDSDKLRQRIKTAVGVPATLCFLYVCLLSRADDMAAYGGLGFATATVLFSFAFGMGFTVQLAARK